MTDDDDLLDSNQVRKIFGNRSAMWITRREQERTNPNKPKFPIAIILGNRKYWKRGELRAYMEECRATGPLPPPKRPLRRQHR
jgi:vancomycin permeability regulator SanA